MMRYGLVMFAAFLTSTIASSSTSRSNFTATA